MHNHHDPTVSNMSWYMSSIDDSIDSSRGRCLHFKLTSYNSGWQEGHIIDEEWMLEKKNLNNTTLNLAFITKYFSLKAACSIFQESIVAFKDYNIEGQFATKHPFFFTDDWPRISKESQHHVVCVCVCVCVWFSLWLHQYKTNQTYQLFHRVLLLLHSFYKRRGLLLCGIHILFLVYIIQDAQWRLEERKEN